jgi:sulfoxide reductase heme-binding subunit YedZ
VTTSLTWVITRAAGYTSFALLTASVALGLLLSSQWRSLRWPRFATTELHRFVTLLTLVFIAIHVAVAVIDQFIRLSLIEVVVPFISHHRPVWSGIGIVTAYLAAAMWLSTLLQRRIGYQWWRRLHFATFAVYAGAVVHSIGSGSDTGSVWSWAIYLASFTLVGGLLALRLSRREQAAPEPAPAAAAPPAGSPPAAGGGGGAPAAAGAAVDRGRPAAGAAARAAEPGFTAQLDGRMHQGPDGTGGILVQLEAALWGGFDGSLELLVQGRVPPGGGRLQVTGNWLSLHTRTGTGYRGRIGVFDGMRLRGHVSPDSGGGPQLAVAIALLTLRDGAVNGTLRAAPVEAGTPARLSSGL